MGRSPDGTLTVLQLLTLIASGLYFGFAVRVMVAYVRRPPRSLLRRAHVWGVSVGTSLLVLSPWWRPLFLVGVLVITVALALLSRDQSRYIDMDGVDAPERLHRHDWRLWRR